MPGQKGQIHNGRAGPLMPNFSQEKKNRSHILFLPCTLRSSNGPYPYRKSRFTSSNCLGLFLTHLRLFRHVPGLALSRSVLGLLSLAWHPCNLPHLFDYPKALITLGVKMSQLELEKSFVLIHLPVYIMVYTTCGYKFKL